MKLLTILAVVLLTFTGCSSMSARKVIDLSHYRRFYVEHRLADNHRIDEQIVAELKSLGYDASCGYLTMKPEGVDAIIAYEDRWTWDFKNYMIDFRLTMRDERTGKQVADGSFHQASITTKSPEEIIREVLTKLLKAG